MIDSTTKVLVVDDYDLVRTMLRKALSELDMKSVQEASNGAIAQQMLEQAHSEGNPFELVFLDWNMPELSGYDLLAQCRSDDRFADLPIIMVTAASEEHLVIKALATGATNYIIKPFSQEVLKDKLDKLRKKLAKSA